MKSRKPSDDYYQTCPFPKPKPTKKRKPLENGYKNKHKRRCWYTGEPGAERHEVFPGIYRQTSIKMGFQVDVCSRIHAELQANGTPWAKTENQKWRMYYQKQYEDMLLAEGLSPERARESWLILMGRNYL